MSRKLITSKVADGSMKVGGAGDPSLIYENRRRFLKQHGKQVEDSTLVQLDYDSDDFCRYSVVDESAKGEGMLRKGRIADGLATQTLGLAMFLPLADCLGTVIYDPEHEALMVTHLGRHNLEQRGGEKSVAFMTEEFGSDPSKLQVTLTPSAGKGNYPLFAFEHQSLEEVALKQLLSNGVIRAHVMTSEADTTTDENYFSHSEFLKSNRPTDGRFAVSAWLA